MTTKYRPRCFLDIEIDDKPGEFSRTLEIQFLQSVDETAGVKILAEKSKAKMYCVVDIFEIWQLLYITVSYSVFCCAPDQMFMFTICTHL